MTVSLRRMETVVRIRSQRPHEMPAKGSFGRSVRQDRFRDRGGSVPISKSLTSRADMNSA